MSRIIPAEISDDQETKIPKWKLLQPPIAGKEWEHRSPTWDQSRLKVPKSEKKKKKA